MQTQTATTATPMPDPQAVPPGVTRRAAAEFGAKPGFLIDRIDDPAAFPQAEAETLLVEYAQMIHGRVTGAGGPDFDWRPHVAGFFAGLDGVLPPNGSYLLVRDATGRPVGTGALRRVSDDTGEMKHLYVRPEARRTGLGRALVLARMAEARAMGLRWLIADTFKVNPELPSLYDQLGFAVVAPSADSKSIAISPEIRDWMHFYRYDLAAQP